MTEIRCDDSFGRNSLFGSVSLETHALSLETHIGVTGDTNCVTGDTNCVTGDAHRVTGDTNCVTGDTHWRHTVSLETLSLERHAVSLLTH